MTCLSQPSAANADAPLRAALYMRVSTGRQADSDLSIPDQRRQLMAYCTVRGWEVAGEFLDAGLSGTDENRPQFQRMLDLATGGGRPFDVVLVHSYSRFARDLLIVELSTRKLKAHSIELISITQELGTGSTAEIARQFIGIVDQQQSRENAKHVTRTMKENANQGFWNGAAAPFGYRTYVAEQRGAKLKKKLQIDVIEAETVRLIFRLIREGDGVAGPMGVKAAASWLNANNYRTRAGARWGIGPLHKLITNPTYKGEYRYNQRDSRAKKLRSESEHIIIAVDPIIDPAVFDAVQAQLKARNPKVTPPRTVTGPTLLTGLATCASCQAGMTLRTGKSGRYRYYTCASAAQKGKSACTGRSVPMDKLDDLITAKLVDDLLTPERVGNLLNALIARQSDRETESAQRLTALKAKLGDAEERLKRLYTAIENGIADPSDPTLKDRIAALRTDRDIAKGAYERAAAELRPDVRINAERIAAFTELMRRNVAGGAVEFRRAWLRSMIDNVEVDDEEIRIHGRRDVLERLVMDGGAAPAGVPSFVRKWRPSVDETDNYVSAGAL